MKMSEVKSRIEQWITVREGTKMKMSEVKSRTWEKMAEIATTDFSVDGIAEAINKEFGEPFFENIVQAIADGYIQICEDGIIIWMS